MVSNFSVEPSDKYLRLEGKYFEGNHVVAGSRQLLSFKIGPKRDKLAAILRVTR